MSPMVEIPIKDLWYISKVLLNWLNSHHDLHPADYPEVKLTFNHVVDILAKARREGIPFGPNDIR